MQVLQFTQASIVIASRTSRELTGQFALQVSNFWTTSCCCRFPFQQRAQLAKNGLGRQLFELMAKKQTNLAVAADVPTAEAMLKLADQVT